VTTTPLSFDLAVSLAKRTEYEYRQILPPFAIVFLYMNQQASERCLMRKGHKVQNLVKLSF
jgi:hypothetical protein